MKLVAKFGLAVLAFSMLPLHQAKAESICIAILTTCPTTPTTPPTTQDAPEISASAASTGLVFVAGVAAMIRSRRKAKQQ